MLWWSILWVFNLLYCSVSAVNDLEVVDCTHGLILSFCNLFFSEKRLRGWSTRKPKIYLCRFDEQHLNHFANFLGDLFFVF